METKQVEIIYDPYIDAYRIYDVYKPEKTFAYTDTLDEAVALAEEHNYEIYILCNT